MPDTPDKEDKRIQNGEDKPPPTPGKSKRGGGGGADKPDSNGKKNTFRGYRDDPTNVVNGKGSIFGGRELSIGLERTYMR